MDRRAFEGVVDEVLAELPSWAVERIHNLRVVVAERPTREQDPDRALLGLYDGVSLPERGAEYLGAMPDTIYVFRQPHLELGLYGEDLRQEIRCTVLHELAHYFGIDDERLTELGWD